jgi:hypothetical protein
MALPVCVVITVNLSSLLLLLLLGLREIGFRSAWTGLIWLRRQTSGSPLWASWFHGMQGISWVAEEWSASQEGLCSMELVPTTAVTCYKNNNNNYYYNHDNHHHQLLFQTLLFISVCHKLQQCVCTFSFIFNCEMLWTSMFFGNRCTHYLLYHYPECQFCCICHKLWVNIFGFVVCILLTNQMKRNYCGSGIQFMKVEGFMSLDHKCHFRSFKN